MFPCDTRLEAFPPYLGRVSSLTRPLFSRWKEVKAGTRLVPGVGDSDIGSISKGPRMLLAF